MLRQRGSIGQQRYTGGTARVKEAALDDLMKEPGKGEVVRIPPTGFLPGFAAMWILFSLHGYATTHKNGYLKTCSDTKLRKSGNIL